MSINWNKVTLTLKKHAPTIMVGTGVVGMVGTVVLASYKTTKLEGILEEYKANVDNLKTSVEDEDNRVILEQNGYTEKDYSRDLMSVHLRGGWSVAKNYLPAFVLGVGSTALILGGYGMLNTRYAGVTAAYTTLHTAFGGYRDRVKDKYGDEIEHDIYYDTKVEEIEEEVTNAKGETKKKKVKKKTENAPINYGRVFGPSNPNWSDTPTENAYFIKTQYNYTNDMLVAKGYVLLNEVYSNLGFPETSAGAVVGWVNKLRPGIGDGEIRFIGEEKMTKLVHDIETGKYLDGIPLDFNVDGVVYDLIDEMGR